ncbi:MAG: hypothetical protein ACYC38_03955 [Eubacteriales bacterium]
MIIIFRQKKNIRQPVNFTGRQGAGSLKRRVKEWRQRGGQARANVCRRRIKKRVRRVAGFELESPGRGDKKPFIFRPVRGIINKTAQVFLIAGQEEY